MEHIYLFPGWTETFILAGKLLLAAVFGGLIGFERESHGQAAGLRTNIIITMTACLLMLTSLHMEEMYAVVGQDSPVSIDPGRIASYSLAGMGFLGAGAIIKGKGGVRGLTTAATLWFNTSVGLAVGAGMFLSALLFSAICLVVLYVIRTRLRTAIDQDLYTVLTIVLRRDNSRLDDFRPTLSKAGVEIQTVNYATNLSARTTTYRLRLYSRSSVERSKLLDALEKTEGLLSLSWDEADVP